MAMRLLHAAETERSQGQMEKASRFYNLAFQREPNSLTLLHSFASFLAVTIQLASDFGLISW